MYLRIIFTLVLILYLAALGYGAVSTDIIQLLQGANDKLLHFIEFFVLAILVFVTLASYDLRWKTTITIIISLIMTVVSEMLQLAIKERTFSYLDMVADLGGIVMGLVLCWVVIWIFWKQ